MLHVEARVEQQPRLRLGARLADDRLGQGEAASTRGNWHNYEHVKVDATKIHTVDSFRFPVCSNRSVVRNGGRYR